MLKRAHLVGVPLGELDFAAITEAEIRVSLSPPRQPRIHRPAPSRLLGALLRYFCYAVPGSPSVR